MRAITSRQNPLVGEFREVARGDDQDRLLLDGAHLVRDALAADVDIRHIMVAADAVEETEISALLATAAARQIVVTTGSAPVMSAVSPVRSSSPIVALAGRPAIDDRLLAPGDSFLVVACDIQDPGNLGAIARVAEAGGANGLIVAGESADPFAWKSLRGSMGSLLRLPVKRTASDDLAFELLRGHGFRIVATTPRDGRSVYHADLTGRSAIFVGGEGRGLSKRIVDDADERLSIPMQPPVESLNAAVTAAIVVYEARRRRG